MNELAVRIQLPIISPVQNVYLALLESIVSQQLSVRVADVIFKRFLQLFENEYPYPNILKEIEIEKLRSTGVSRSKAQYLKNVANFTLENDLSYERVSLLDDQVLIDQLTQIKGIGRWSVEMLLIFELNRPDVFSISDLGIRQSMIKLYGLDQTKKELDKRLVEISDQWSPNRSTACRLLWKAKDLKS
jgi:DNA-3-methyladenine glycosylase II